MKKRIGTDVSLAVCRLEGYLTVVLTSKSDYEKIDPDKVFEFGKTWPHLGGKAGQKYERAWHSASGLWAEYLAHKDSIDSLIGSSHEFPNDIHALLWLASDVDAYGSYVFG